MPSDLNAVHAGSVPLDVALLLRLVLAPKLRAVMPHNVDVVNVGLVVLQNALILRPVHPPTYPARPPRPSFTRLLRNPLSPPPLLFPATTPFLPLNIDNNLSLWHFGISKRSTFSSVRQFGQVQPHPFPHAMLHVVSHPLQTSASTPLPLPLQLSKQKGQPKGPSGSCSTFTFFRGGSELIMRLMMHWNKSLLRIYAASLFSSNLPCAMFPSRRTNSEQSVVLLLQNPCPSTICRLAPPPPPPSGRVSKGCGEQYGN